MFTTTQNDIGNSAPHLIATCLGLEINTASGPHMATDIVTRSPAVFAAPDPLYLSEIGLMLEMVTSGSFSSTLSIPQVASESQREPKDSKENGLSLYLARQQRGSKQPEEKYGGQVSAPAAALLWGPRGESSNIIKQVQL